MVKHRDTAMPHGASVVDVTVVLTAASHIGIPAVFEDPQP